MEDQIWYGIKDECCMDDKNIVMIAVNSTYGQCQKCKRVFKHA